MPRLTARERREGYLREYGYQQKTGKPFFPYALVHDVISNCFFVVLIIGLACVWYFTAKHGVEHQHRRQERRARPALRGPRRPRGRELRPAPGVVLLLPVRAAAAVPEPGPAAVRARSSSRRIFMVVLIGMPFIDRSRERRLSHRPIAVGFAGGDGACCFWRSPGTARRRPAAAVDGHDDARVHREPAVRVLPRR